MERLSKNRVFFALILVAVLVVISSAFPTFTGYQVAGNESVQVTPGLPYYVNEFILPRFTQIITSPFTDPQMLWIALPLLIVLLFMQLYFGRWKNEKLGWASAFADWIALLFVGVNLLREMLVKYAVISEVPAMIYILPAVPIAQTYLPLEVLAKFLLIFILLFFSLLFMIVLFTHAIPKRISFVISSPLAVYSFAFIMISIVYSDIPLDLYTLIASILVYIFVLMLFQTIKIMTPPSAQARHYLLRKAFLGRRERAAKKAAKSRKRHKLERMLLNFLGGEKIPEKTSKPLENSTD